jgi:hypothetical protein
MALDLGFLIGNLGKLAQAGVSTIAQAQARQQAASPRKKGPACTPCAAKAAVVAARQRVSQGKL